MQPEAVPPAALQRLRQRLAEDAAGGAGRLPPADVDTGGGAAGGEHGDAAPPALCAAAAGEAVAKAAAVGGQLVLDGLARDALAARYDQLSYGARPPGTEADAAGYVAALLEQGQVRAGQAGSAPPLTPCAVRGVPRVAERLPAVGRRLRGEGASAVSGLGVPPGPPAVPARRARAAALPLQRAVRAALPHGCGGGGRRGGLCGRVPRVPGWRARSSRRQDGEVAAERGAGAGGRPACRCGGSWLQGLPCVWLCCVSRAAQEELLASFPKYDLAARKLLPERAGPEGAAAAAAAAVPAVAAGAP